MSRGFAVKLTAVMVSAIVLLLAASMAHPQATPVASRAAALEQRLRDLHEHRDWLEDQLAAAKVIAAELQAQLEAARAAKCPAATP